jgi:uncharacterized Zn-finger protein
MTTPHPEILSVPKDVETIVCNGGGGALGHPRVYYTFHDQDEVVCGYCDRLFTKKDVAGAVPYQGKDVA